MVYETTCGDLFKTKSNYNIEDLLRNYETIEILKNVTITEDKTIIAPIFKNHKGISSLNIYEIPIDILIICEKTLQLNEIYFIIFEKLKLQIEIIKQCYLTFYKVNIVLNVFFLESKISIFKRMKNNLFPNSFIIIRMIGILY